MDDFGRKACRGVAGVLEQVLDDGEPTEEERRIIVDAVRTLLDLSGHTETVYTREKRSA